MATEYFFISDLHIGGDGPLDFCEFEEELIAYLQNLANHPGDAELIIVGDAFGLWEYSEHKGVDKLRVLASSHTELFEQFRKTGEKIKITLIPGNHDYDLACYPEYVPLLREYNINLEQKIAITREVAGKKLWIEHGNQHDAFNCFEEFGDPASSPAGYFVTKQFVSGASEISAHGEQNWLKDIQAVYPTEHVPHWVYSNYFYREMSPMLRYLLIPFLVLFTFSIAIVFISIAEEWGLIGTQISKLQFLEWLGSIGAAIGVVITVNSSVITFLLLLAIPLYFIFKDVKATLLRYKLITPEGLVIEKEEDYDNAAREVFAKDPDVVAFIYGHTHKVSLKKEGDRVIINTGTWLKKLTRVSTLFRFIPDIYAPSYCLNYFHIYEKDGKVAIAFKKVPKESISELTTMQQWMITFKGFEDKVDIPDLTIL